MLPSNPTVNQTYSVGSRLYDYNGVRWEVTRFDPTVIVTKTELPPDNQLIPDDDYATERERLLSFGSRLYKLDNGKWTITTPTSVESLYSSVIEGPPGPQGPQGVPGSGGSDPNVQSQINDIMDKIVSIDERLEGLPTDFSGYLKLEDNTTPGVQSSYEEPPEFFDNIPDGDINRFTVGINDRGVYTLEGVPQPSIEVPVPDLVVFDLSELPEDDYENFDIYKNGVILEQGVLREYDERRITLYTSQIPQNLDRLFYKHRTKKGMGFTISIIRF